MSDVAISVENLGKQYRIGTRERHDTLRDAVAARFARRDRSDSESDTFWALRDVSFEVKRGEVMGVIGRNGAGKSTLLKILSRITEPSTGRAVIHGRVGSLLEVGTGFHPELTGRENIYLNGAILGMHRSEIDRRFDEIVAFSEIERFLDTPVKRYSSGMYVRLAFAVAAHLEPEVLIVDEVLAVGDAAFQKKCLGKMGDVAGEGRTVLFVSHNMAAVQNLCARAVLLEEGHISRSGTARETIGCYLNLASGQQTSVTFSRPERDSVAWFETAELRDGGGVPVRELLLGGALTIELAIRAEETVRDIQVSFIIRTISGQGVYHCIASDSGLHYTADPGRHLYVATLPHVRLYPGRYVIDSLWLADSAGQAIDFQMPGLTFEVLDGAPHQHRRLWPHLGMVYEVPDWQVSKVEPR